MLLTNGVVDDRYTDLSQFSFLGVPLGDKLEVLRRHAADKGLRVVALTDFKSEDYSKPYLIRKFDLGGVDFNVILIADQDNELTQFRFEKDIPTELSINSEYVLSSLNYLTGIFKKKYGEPLSKCSEEIPDNILWRNDRTYSHCEWQFGDVYISVCYDRSESKVFGSIVSLSAALQSYNISQIKLNEQKAELKTLIDATEDEMHQVGADSY